MQNTSLHKAKAAGDRSVAIIVATDDKANFLAEALQSCIQQTTHPAEILLVCDGSRDEADRLAASFPGVTVYPQDSAGRSGAQSAALERVSSEFMVFLDANARLTPSAIQAGLECFDKHPDASAVWGGHRVTNAAGQPASPVWHERLSGKRSIDMLRGGEAIAVQAAVMYRTGYLRYVLRCKVNPKVDSNGNANLQMERIVTHDCCVAEYRYDGQLMLARSIVGLQIDGDRLGEADTAVGRGLLFHHNAPQLFAAAVRELIRNGWNFESAKMIFRMAKMAPLALLRTIMSRGATVVMRRLPRPVGRLFGEALWAPAVGSMRFGDFARTRPISADYGFDRGKPLDRYYIERVLKSYSGLVRGRVLEVGGNHYTRWYGAEKVVRSDILDINPLNPLATIVADLGIVGAVPEEAFDCIVFTQTLQLIYNHDNAMDNLYRALAPGGVLLITVPGISPIGPEEIRYWHWSFTELSLKSMLSHRFGENNVVVQSHGNVFAAICFLTGLSLEEIDKEKLEYRDESYPVTIFGCARRPR